MIHNLIGVGIGSKTSLGCMKGGFGIKGDSTRPTPDHCNATSMSVPFIDTGWNIPLPSSPVDILFSTFSL